MAPPPPAAPKPPATTAPAWPRRALVLLGFAIACACRTVVFDDYHENDERLYAALVENLAAGKGYTLQGHPILQEPWVAKEQYDVPLFYHPPGGLLLFWAAHALGGGAALPWVQMVAFAVFYAGMLAAWRALRPEAGLLAWAAVAALAGFSPIMTHVLSRCWLEGPQLAAVAVATALYLRSLASDRRGAAAGAGLALGYAGLVKATAALVVPGLLLLGHACWRASGAPRRRFLGASAWLLGAAAVSQLPWLLWQWQALGSPFPRWSGKPVPQLVAENPYVQFVTVVRQPWCYLSLLPRTLWTLGPLLLLSAAGWREAACRRTAVAAASWVAVVVGANLLLGALGYAKLLRYVVLVTPATILWFGAALASTAARAQAAAGTPGRPLARWLLALALAGLALEVIQGVVTPRQARVDLVLPLFGPFD